jgi:prephenate dehydratase
MDDADRNARDTPVVPTPSDAAPLPRVAFQGEPGAFSEVAIRTEWPAGAIAIPCRTFTDLVDAVLDGHADFGVVPIANVIAGPVAAALAALDAAATRVRRLGEVTIPVHHCLMAPPGATLAGLHTVHSHQMALAQCRIFFARHPWLTPAEHDDTAGAARDVAACGDRQHAAIASRAAAERYALEVLASGIQDHAGNFTHFTIIRAS